MADSALASIPDASASPKFEGVGLLPKQETQAIDFVRKNPTFDGRGVIVAIFDSGIDPGAPGLQVTSTGDRKILALLDCSGSGDVQTTTVKRADDGVLVGLSGRTLHVSSFEAPPSGEYRLGLKLGYDMMPSTLKSREKAERKEKFEKVHRQHINDLNARLVALGSTSQSNGTADNHGDAVKNADSAKQEKEDLQAQIEMATQLMRDYSDPGPLYDIVSWKASDGEWRVVVDTTETGELKDLKVLRPFAVAGDFTNFGPENMLNYSVNVWNDGDIVEIVTNAGSHGTHVAGIVGAYLGEDNALNGVAPGCQIIGLKIGDSRIGSMETSTAMIRALIAARQMGADLMNMSYGESAALPNVGQFIETLNETVYENNIMFFTSASNSGPALSSVGAPGCSTDSVIAVAACVSPPMMNELYSMRETQPLTLYSWSSRGPGINGGTGPTLAAPGGAIAPVPNWTLQKNQLMNGTSMASPNACGNGALLLSALKQSKISYSPSTIRQALENSAKPIPDHDFTAYGAGLIQVADAFNYYVKNRDNIDHRVRLSVTVQSRNNNRGIILRDPNDFFFPQTEETIKIEPVFCKGTPSEVKIAFEKRYALRATVPWITCPEVFQLAGTERAFKIQIIPPTLDPQDTCGAYFVGEVYAIDTQRPELGRAFSVPVTVIRPAPQVLDTYRYTGLSLQPGTIYRRFYAPPTGSTWATITIQSRDWPYTRTAVFAAQQIIPDVSHKFDLYDKYISLKGTEERKIRIPLLPELSLEVVVGQLWSALGSEGSLDFSVEFSGINVHGLLAQSSYGEISRIMVHNTVGVNTLTLKPQLVAVARTLHPTTNSGVTPLHRDRDLLSKERLIYQLTLEYTYTTDEANIKVLPRLPFSRLLYDSPFECQLIMIYDSNKNLIATRDFSPDWLTLEEKGTYTFRLQLRHSDTSVLDKQKTMSISLERQLPKDKGISLNVYRTLSDAVSYGKKWPADGIKALTHPILPAYIAAPSSGQMPSYVKHGDTLYGTLTLSKIEGAKESAFDEHGLQHDAVAVLPIKFAVPSKPPTSTVVAPTPPAAPAPAPLSTSSTPAPSPAVSTPSTPAPTSSPAPSSSNPPVAATSSPSAPTAISSFIKGEEEEKSEPLKALSNCALGVLASLHSASKFDEWAAHHAEYGKIFPKLLESIEVQLQELAYLANLAPKSSAAAETLFANIDRFTARIDQTALAVYFGTRHPKEKPQEKAKAERARELLTTALALKARNLDKTSAEFTRVVDEISKWIDPSTITPPLEIPSNASATTQYYGLALKALRKTGGEKTSKTAAADLVKCLKSLGWKHWEEHYELWNVIRFTRSYELF